MAKVAKRVNVDKEPSPLVDLKISNDGGETWTRRKVNMGEGLEESDLQPGEMFMFNGEKYVVEKEDGELGVRKIEKGKR